MATRKRLLALAWYDDHSRDRNSVFGRAMPSVRMRTECIKSGQLSRVPVGSFKHVHFVLTEEGRRVLDAARNKKKKKGNGDDGCEAGGETIPDAARPEGGEA